MSRSGFTLIELLIVVAIIGILAAIAIPNFLQAQVRAKVSRAMADQRSLALAFETYHVDANAYPISHDVLGVCVVQVNNPDRPVMCLCYPGTRTQVFGGYWPNRVTTPIDYISTLPKDPFLTNYWGAGIVQTPIAVAEPNAIRNYFVWVWPYGHRTTPGLTPAQADIFCMITSPGPDRKIALGGDWQENEMYYKGIYDPSNGTVSAGNITRFVP